jgi:uncharacterized sulfatase
LTWVEKSELDDVIVVVTADHGDLFGEQGIIGHKLLLHDGLIRVPLVVFGLDLDITESPLIQHSDLMKTLLARAGAGTDQINGIDLSKNSREFAFSQRGKFQNIERFAQYDQEIYDRNIPQSQTTAIRSQDYKLVKSNNGTKLYQLPNEIADVSGEKGDIENELEKELDEWVTDIGVVIKSKKEREITD